MAATHLITAGASFVAGALFVRIGWVVRRRAAPPGEPRQAMRAFTVWWVAIGLSTAATGGLVLAGAVGSHLWALAFRVAALACSALAMWGLLTYIAYIYRGDHRASGPIAAAYALFLVLAVASLVWPEPATLAVRAWTADFVAPDGGGMRPLVAVLILAFLVPPVVAGPLFLRLLRTMPDVARRRRVLAVGIGIPVWALTHLVARLSDADAWQAFTRVVVGVVVALVIARAYAPGGGVPAPSPLRSEEALRARVQELI